MTTEFQCPHCGGRCVVYTPEAAPSPLPQSDRPLRDRIVRQQPIRFGAHMTASPSDTPPPVEVPPGMWRWAFAQDRDPSPSAPPAEGR